MNTIDSIAGTLVEMRLIVEGAVSIFEKVKDTHSDDFSLIGEALYILRARLCDCLVECQESGKSV